MTPGLTKWNSEIQRGDVVAIVSQTAVPMAVGIAAHDIGKLSKVVGEKGKAVYLVHCCNDELWGLGSKTKPPENLAVQDDGLEKATAEMTLAEDGEPLPAEGVGEPKDGSIVSMEGDAAEGPSAEAPVHPAAEAPMEPSTSGTNILNGISNTAEIDDVFKAAAIYGLYQLTINNAQNTLSMPLPSSTLISNHLNPFLPESFSQYTFKKTSWKKAATFLKKYMEKEGLVKTKDRSGDIVILSINWNHKLIKEFKPYPLEKKEEKTAGKDEAEESTPMIQIQELFKPTGKVIKTLVELQKKSYYLPTT